MSPEEAKALQCAQMRAARRQRGSCGESGGQHFFMVIGKPGLRSPVCVYCGHPYHHTLSEEEWDAYESHWRDERHVVFRTEVDLGMRVDSMDIEHAWAAGFIDGEGCLQAYETGPNKIQVEIAASQAVKGPLEKLQGMYGGSIRTMPERRPNHRPRHSWSVQSSRAARRILPLWIPYLTVKRKQAELLLELSMTYRGRGRHAATSPEVLDQRSSLAVEIRRLKKET